MKTHERIAKLLAKAENTDNLDEAATYVAKAQELATLYAIDLQSLSIGREPSAPTHRMVNIGVPRARRNKPLVLLFHAVAEANDVVVDVARNSTYVIAYGLPESIDLVEQLWSSLAVQMTSAATTFLRTDDWRPEGLTAQQARATFNLHFVDRIRQRLDSARVQAATDYDLGHEGSPGALVLLKDARARVDEYRAANSSARGTWRGYSGYVGDHRGESARAGRQAGDRAKFAPPDALGGQRPGLPGTDA